MDPTHTSKSTRARRGRFEKSVGTAVTLYTALDHLSEALAVVETVSRALHAAENEQHCAHIGAEITTLRQGVVALRAIHEEFDYAIAGAAP
jgi:hypothetical protein